MLLFLACLLGVAAIAVLRYAWSLPRRSAGLNGLAWAMIATFVLCGWWAEGAWGVAVASLWAIAAAFVALAIAGLRSPPSRARPPERRARVLPDAGGRWRVGRRVVTFVIVVPLALAAALALAVAMRGLGGALGWGEANANVAALFLLPLAWSVLVFALLMQARRRAQLTTLLACGLVSAPFLLTGIGA